MRKLLRPNDWIKSRKLCCSPKPRRSRGRPAREICRSPATDLAVRIAGAIVLSLGVGVVLTGSARAAIVTNGNFEVPSVASAPNGFLDGSDPALNVPGVGLSFPSVTGGYSGITIEQSAGALDAPQTPDSSQVGWIINLGQISQQINLQPGGYTLSFKLAQRAAGYWQGAPTPIPLPIRVTIGSQQQVFTPTSATSYTPFNFPFQIPAGGGVVGLNFAGTGDPYDATNDNHTTFIDAVSITPIPTPKPAPVITGALSDLDPTSIVTLQGSNFGAKPQKIKIVFPNPSETPFANGSKSEITLDSVGADDVAAFTAPIDTLYPTGKVDEQTVEITIISGDTGLSSSVRHAKFIDKAVITSCPSAVTPGQEFILKGWDFDSKAECSSGNAGKVTVHFPLKSAVTLPNAGSSHSDLVIPISSDNCQPDAIKVTLPSDTQGVVRQTVDITYESPAGRKSNTCQAELTPKLVTLVAPYNWVSASCSNASSSDNCNDLRFGWCWSQEALWGLLGYWPPDLDSMVGDHHECWGIGSDSGTDVYTLSLPTVGANGKPLTDPKDGWIASGFGGWTVESDNAIAGNGIVTNGCPNQQLCFPATYVQASVNWRAGASGGDLDYTWDIYIRGPVGSTLPFSGAAYPPYD